MQIRIIPRIPLIWPTKSNQGKGATLILFARRGEWAVAFRKGLATHGHVVAGAGYRAEKMIEEDRSMFDWPRDCL